MDKKQFMQLALSPRAKRLGRPVPLVPFAAWDYYYTTSPLEWRADGDDATELTSVIVPTGFVTDLASIPQIFWSALPPTGMYAYPAIIHDYLYWFQPINRESADQIFKLAMEDAQVPAVKVMTIFAAVRAGGASSWNANTAAREAGEKRILRSFPDQVTTSWREWKQRDVFA